MVETFSGYFGTFNKRGLMNDTGKSAKMCIRDRPGSAVVVEKLGNINNLNDEKIDSFYTIVARLFGSY